jgi:ABC-type nitrate/sulfonate/bicarbonate transport system substrate-binding protein
MDRDERPPAGNATSLTVTVFPGAANAPLYHAIDDGWFADAAVELRVIHVGSSTEQLDLWDNGQSDVMHTSPDHLLRQHHPRQPVIVRRDGFGELSVYQRAERTDPAEITWAVDGIDSGFAFVLRALLEDRAGVPAERQRLRTVGGTKERFDALQDAGSPIGGTTLHPPFDALAEQAGLRRLAGHLDTMRELLTQVTIVSRASAASPAVRCYLDVLDRAVEELVAGDEPLVERVLAAHGFPGPAAGAGARGILGPGGIRGDRTPELRGLEVAAELRGRFSPGWRAPTKLDELIDPN